MSPRVLGGTPPIQENFKHMPALWDPVMGERGGSCSRRGLTALPCPSRLVVRMCGGSVHRSIPSEDRRRSPETRMAHCTKAVAWSREPIPVDRGRPMIESEPFRSSFPTKWICEGGRYPGECRTDCLSGECCYLPLTKCHARMHPNL